MPARHPVELSVGGLVFGETSMFFYLVHRLVLEVPATWFGLRGFGSHSNDNEYIFIENIEPRLYLAVRMIMDFSRGKVAAQ